MKFSLYAYLWDLTDRPLQDALAQLKPLGCDSITLAASYHAGKFLQPHNKNRRVYFPEDGTVYFHPKETYGEVRPEMSSIVRETDFYEKIASATDVHAWTVLLHNSRLGTKHPHLTVKNAYGDGYVYSLCPSQQAVREYAVTLCCDLAKNYPIKSVLVETPGFLPYAHGYHHEFSQFPLNFFVEALLGLCFCDACHKAAAASDLDLSALKEKVKQKLDSQFKDARQPDGNASAPDSHSRMIPDLLSDNSDDLVTFIRWRSQQVTSLLAEIKQSLPAQASFGCIPSVQQSLSIAWTEGTDYAAFAKTADYLELPLYNDNLAENLSNLQMVRDSLNGEDTPINCILRPDLMRNEGPPEETLLALEEQGIPLVAFYNYGLLPESDLQSLGAALNRSKRKGA